MLAVQGELRQRPSTASILWAAVASGLVAFLAVVSEGSLPVALGAGACGLLLVASVLQPAAVLALLVAAVLLFEQYAIAGISSWTADSPLYKNLHSLAPIPLPASALEILLLVLVAGWAIRCSALGRWRIRTDLLFLPAALFLLVLAAQFVRGVLTGGDLKVALWEVRALCYWPFLVFVVPQIVANRRDAILVVRALILAVALKGLQGVGRYFLAIEGRIDSVSAITSHEDALFLLTQFALLAGLIVHGGEARARRCLLWTFPTSFATFLLAQRRVAFGAVLFVIPMLFAMANGTWRRRMAIASIPCLMAGVLYGAVFWDRPYGTLSMPLRQVRSVFSPRPGSNEEQSNRFREVERFNLKITIRTSKMGTGFGHKVLSVVPLPHIHFPLYEYIPHNEILWLWAKTGLVGFSVFWLFVLASLVRAVQGSRLLADPTFRAVSIAAAVALVCQMLVSTYDLQLTYARNMVHLGLLGGLVLACRHIEEGRRTS